ncbi:MAG: hypothetical protein H6738_01355 [Alphaproteobacteria bacterium]|nr:hypothetical protein [Alphaproteobacteria bacterium]MCB9695414.1 hypothetical protein [Alphaproteobacteria bacterium]
MSRFQLLPVEAPDEVDLELAEMGAPLHATQRERIDAAPEADELRASFAEARRDFDRLRRPLPHQPANDVRPWRWVAAAAALAAAIGLVVLARGPDDDGVRAMGGLPVDLAVRHVDGTTGTPEHLAAGDELFVKLVAPADGVVEVVTVQDDGAVSILDPGHDVRARERFVLDGAARLDDHHGREWLVVTWVDRGRDAVSIEADARSLLPDPAAHAGPRRSVTEITRGR